MPLEQCRRFSRLLQGGRDRWNERAKGAKPLERDAFSSNRHPAPSFCLSVISAQTRSAFVARENRYPPSGRARGHAFPDHALAVKLQPVDDLVDHLAFGAHGEAYQIE